MKRTHPLLLPFGLTIMLAFVSCQSNIEPPTATLPPTTTVSVTLSQPSLELSTVSPMPTAIMGAEETTPTFTIITPTSSPTIVPTTITPSLTPAPPTVVPVTLTPLPTLESEEFKSAMTELLTNPMNCNVPCWWGAVPNETTTVEILQFLTLYQFTFHERYDNQIPDFIEVWVGFDENENQFDFRVMYSFESNVLKGMLVEQSRPLEEISGKYGQPDEVWFSTESSVRDGNLAVRLIMVYLQKAMAVGYVVNGTLQNGVVIGCFNGNEPGRLQLNTPGSSTNHEDFRGIFEEDRLYLPLEEATNLTIEDFMQQFNDPTQPHCIETPTELWE